MRLPKSIDNKLPYPRDLGTIEEHYLLSVREERIYRSPSLVARAATLRRITFKSPINFLRVSSGVLDACFSILYSNGGSNDAVKN